MNIIVAINNLNYIGKEGKMLWKSKEDFKHFKEKTMGGILLIGKTTYEVDLGKRNLPGRELVVVGTGYNTLYQAIEKCILSGKEIWIIGGMSIYNQLLPLVENLHISHINNNDIGDVQFKIPDTYRGKIHHYYFDENKKEVL